uniref:Secreted protein n=1 Tax=Trichogramma kaykai TaxID=54128 RepID=A0ABD2X934_9HYME
MQQQTPLVACVCVQLGADRSRPCAAPSAISALRQRRATADRRCAGAELRQSHMIFSKLSSERISCTYVRVLWVHIYCLLWKYRIDL